MNRMEGCRETGEDVGGLGSVSPGRYVAGDSGEQQPLQKSLENPASGGVGVECRSHRTTHCG